MRRWNDPRRDQQPMKASLQHRPESDEGRALHCTEAGCLMGKRARAKVLGWKPI